jgi:hypothetical protein
MTDPYTIKIGGVIADPYRIAISYGLDSAIGEAAKKLLRCGRKHKDIKTDVQEAIKTLTRWLVIQDDIERERAVEERSKQYVSSTSITGLDLAYPKGDASYVVNPGFVSEEASRRFPYPNPDYVDAKDDTVHVDLSKLSGDELTAAGFMEDGIVREVLKQQSNTKIGPYTLDPAPSVTIVSGVRGNHIPAPGIKTNMEKLLDERDGETNWP